MKLMQSDNDIILQLIFNNVNSNLFV